MIIYPNVNDNVEVPDRTPDGTLFICINQTYGQISPITRNQYTLEECVCGFWT